jgi:selenoprotein W-related protein
LKKEFGVEAELSKGFGGIFDVEVDGQRVYSKHDTGRFPEPGEIVGLLQR